MVQGKLIITVHRFYQIIFKDKTKKILTKKINLFSHKKIKIFFDLYQLKLEKS